jgi:dihydropteroate synthase
MKLRCRNGLLALESTAVMGILNVTPDSFSDGGLWLDVEAAVGHGVEMAAQGAAIIDVGGESTRPGADPVEEADELDRILPVVERLADRLEVAISIDTRKASVARRAIEAGASIVNDTRGEGSDSSLLEVAAATGAGLVLMHSRGSPVTMRTLTAYEDVVADVVDWLRRRADEARHAGVPADAIVVDPGFGFAKTPGQCLELLRRLDELVALDYAVLVGTSRKSFITAVLEVDAGERLEGTAATVAWAVAEGAHIVRVHDVVPVVRVVRMIEAIRDAGSELPRWPQAGRG